MSKLLSFLSHTYKIMWILLVSKILNFQFFTVFSLFCIFRPNFFDETSKVSIVTLSIASWKLGDPRKGDIRPQIDMFEAQKTQRFWFQISFSFLLITPTFLGKNSIPAPVLESTLQCGSNGILNLKIGWGSVEIFRETCEVRCYMSGTVL